MAYNFGMATKMAIGERRSNTEDTTQKLIKNKREEIRSFGG